MRHGSGCLLVQLVHNKPIFFCLFVIESEVVTKSIKSINLAESVGMKGSIISRIYWYIPMKLARALEIQF